MKSKLVILILLIVMPEGGRGAVLVNDSRVVGSDGYTFCKDLNQDYFICDGGAVVRCTIWCDLHEDCADGFDERMEWCHETYERAKVSPYCHDVENDGFLCDHKRMPCLLFCDGKPDCEDGKDEVKWHCDHFYPDPLELEAILQSSRTNIKTSECLPSQHSSSSSAQFLDHHQLVLCFLLRIFWGNLYLLSG